MGVLKWDLPGPDTLEHNFTGKVGAADVEKILSDLSYSTPVLLM